MLAWVRRAASRASSRSAARILASASRSGRMRFEATVRCKAVGAAMHGAPDLGAAAAAEARQKLELAESPHRCEYSTGRNGCALTRPRAPRSPPARRARIRRRRSRRAAHFVAGEEEYARGRWREALREFEAGYALSPRPEFLINFAQVHRKLGEYDAAARECRRYLATAPPPELAAQAQRLLEQIEDERAHAPPAPHATPPNAPPTTAPSPTRRSDADCAARRRAAAGAAEEPAQPGSRPSSSPASSSVAAAVTVGARLRPAGDTTRSRPTPLGTVDFR